MTYATKALVGVMMSTMCSSLSDNHTALGVSLTLMATGWMIFGVVSLWNAMRETV